MSQQEQIILGNSPATLETEKEVDILRINIGAVISLTQEEDGTYYAKQTGSDILNAPGKHARGRYEIDCSFGPITVSWIIIS